MGTNTSKSPRPAMRGISNRERLAIQKQVQALLPQGMNFDDFFPPHGVSYGTGNREGVDAPGAGRGMVYAAAIIMALDAAGFSSFSGLMVQAGVDWEVYMLRLDSEMATPGASVVGNRDCRAGQSGLCCPHAAVFLWSQEVLWQ